ncbi:MAG: MerR family transcriptional regulator [Erythrobacter sp.]
MAEFEDGKDESALRTIGEVSEALRIKPHVLRYWEQQFSLLKPLKRSGGRRYYRPEDVALVEDIDRLVNEEGYTLKGAEAVLRGSGRKDLDRRQAERRAGERRTAEEIAAEENAQPGTEIVIGGTKKASKGPKKKSTSSGADMTETLAQLKSIRKRLAQAIEA